MSAGKHPSSDGLRAFADWLDQHGQNIGNVGVYGWMKSSTPEALAIMRRDFGSEIVNTSYHFPQLTAVFDNCTARIFFDKSQAFERRVVTREELIPPEVLS